MKISCSLSDLLCFVFGRKKHKQDLELNDIIDMLKTMITQKSLLIIGSSGSGKTRFFVKSNINKSDILKGKEVGAR